jgi:hypothetical protein
MEKYPIIRIDFNSLNYTHGSEGFEKNLINTIKTISNNYNIKIQGEDYKELFKNLIIELSKIDKVVIIIDEYDKPIYLVGVSFDSKIRNIKDWDVKKLKNNE